MIRQRSQIDKRKVELYLSNSGTLLLQDSPKPLQEHLVDVGTIMVMQDITHFKETDRLKNAADIELIPQRLIKRICSRCDIPEISCPQTGNFS